MTSNKKTHQVINAVAPLLDLNSQPQHYRGVRGQSLAQASLPKDKRNPAVFDAEEAAWAAELICTFAELNLLPLPGFKPQTT